ncbi:class I SAM-dependent methyltransferase [Nostoc sp. KVJ3]|uniref:class I SAM-dependent methyltransferase n=1 Tax=Nostoc sp. KVJ3 TaxID=457945 RepID=UPI002237C1B2|nr:class I SAM-dependent methyltransferase [Nostoc sp. KVJ3]
MVQQLFTQGSLFDLQTVIDYGQSVINVAQELAKVLIDNRPLSTKTVSSQMNRYFLGTAASGAWQWKDAYEAVEVAQILYLRHLGIKILSLQPQVVVQQLEELTALCPTHTRRSEESVQLQQFSTPLPLAYLVAKAGFIQADDLILEPSAGTGLLAQMAKLHSASLILNELAPDRSKILRRLFPGTPLFSVNAEQINDYLVGKTQPSVVLMNPPFCASPKINSRNPDATPRHINSALQRLADGGRLVTITANWFSPANPSWRETFVKWQDFARVLLSVGINGKVYSKHGTTMETRITVIDKVPADNPGDIPCIPETLDLPDLLALIEQLPQRSSWERSDIKATAKAIVVQLPFRTTVAQPETVSSLPDDVVVLEYEVIEWTASEGLKDTYTKHIAHNESESRTLYLIPRCFAKVQP